MSAGGAAAIQQLHQRLGRLHPTKPGIQAGVDVFIRQKAGIDGIRYIQNDDASIKCGSHRVDQCFLSLGQIVFATHRTVIDVFSGAAGQHDQRRITALGSCRQYRLIRQAVGRHGIQLGDLSIIGQI